MYVNCPVRCYGQVLLLSHTEISCASTQSAELLQSVLTLCTGSVLHTFDAHSGS